MPPRTRTWPVVGCMACLAAMVLLVSAASASATANIRFVHAVPGAGAAKLELSHGSRGAATPPVSFGEVSPPLEVDAGTAKLTAAPADGSTTLAGSEQHFEDGKSYTVIALQKRPEGPKLGVTLKVLEYAPPMPGKALLRAVNAAPEMGDPDVRVDDRVVAEKLAYAEATEYVEVPPGTHDVSAARTGGDGGPLATKKDVPLTAGTATTAIALGSGGEMTRVLTLSDGTAAPPGAPATGLGGAAPEDAGPSRLLVALLAALAAAGVGAAGWALSGRR